MTHTATRNITMAHSPDADDAFMFYGLSTGTIPLDGFTITDHLEDIQTLNQRAIRGDFEVTAISVATYPSVVDRYWIMSAGASVGRGYGPVIVSKEPMALADLAGKRVAIPGLHTTAGLVLQLAAPGCEPVPYAFDHILDAVASGEFEAGVIIHEGQLFYAQAGVQRVMDLGVWWKEQHGGLPLPLGLDVVRQDVGKELATKITEALRQSIQCAYDHPDESLTYALQFGRGINRQVGDTFVKMYVNDDTLNIPDDVVQAIKILFKHAHAKGLIPCNPPLTIV